MCSRIRWRMLEQLLHMRRNQGMDFIHTVIFHTFPRLAAVFQVTHVQISSLRPLSFSMKVSTKAFDQALVVSYGYGWPALCTPLPHRLEAEATYTRCHIKSEAEKTKQRQIVQELSQRMNSSKRKSETLSTEVSSLVLV